MLRTVTNALLAGSLMLTAACGGGTDKKEGGSSKKEPAAAVALQPLDLTAHGIPFSIQAPAGAAVAKDPNTSQLIVSKDRFNIIVGEEKYAEEGATPAKLKDEALAQDTKMNNDAQLGMKMEVLAGTATGYLYMVTNGQGAKMVRFKQFAEKGGKLYKMEENFMELNSAERSMETGYSISREEAEAMYNAVKQ
jgi:hypothetical protein